MITVFKPARARTGRATYAMAVGSALLLAFTAGVRSSTAATMYMDQLAPTLERVRYTDAMMNCAGRMLATGQLACDYVPADKEVQHSFWIWQNEAGALVNRTLSGDYRLRESECVTGFCAWQECRISKWPVFSCDDGTTRQGAVEDRVRLILDDMPYERVRSE